MIINKDYMMIMRAGKLSMSGVKKQNDSGMLVALCLLIAAFVIVIGMVIK